MVKTCPFGYSNTVVHCNMDKCVMYEDGCLFKKAIKVYIENNAKNKEELK